MLEEQGASVLITSDVRYRGIVEGVLSSLLLDVRFYIMYWVQTSRQSK